MTRSLQRTLLMFILLPLGFLLIGSGLLSLQQSRNVAGLVTDHNLLASARVMAQGIHVQDGVMDAEILPSAIEMLASPEQDMVYYQLRGRGGAILAGQPDLADVRLIPPEDRPIFRDLDFRGHAIRIVQTRQPVAGSAPPGFAVITVGETLGGRERLVQQLWLTGFLQQMGLVAAAAVLGWLGLYYGLSPLKQLRSRMAMRQTGELTPLKAPEAPAEVQPLIDSLNDYVARLGLLMETQRRFVANAAHQLRTPLTLLKTQATFGLREKNTAGKNEALNGISGTLDHLTRLTNQLLVLARAEPGTNHGARTDVDLVVLLHKLMVDFAPIALDHRIDFGIECSEKEIWVHGNPTLLRELMANVIDNALRYTGAHGVVTVKLAALGQIVHFQVLDTGPGIAEDEREKVFERFYRVQSVKGEGSGLGLAIVSEIINSHNGRVTLGSPAHGSGLVVEITLPQL